MWLELSVPPGALDQGSRRLELLLRQPDVRMAPERLREDAGRLDRRRVVQVADRREHADREAPRPALFRGVVLGHARDFGDREHALPDCRVEDRELARLDRRTLRRRVRDDRVRVDRGSERPRAPSANEEPCATRSSYRRSTTAAMAMPNPMHMHATP